MSQTTFGILMLTALLFICGGMAVWADWPNIKRRCQKILRVH